MAKRIFAIHSLSNLMRRLLPFILLLTVFGASAQRTEFGVFGGTAGYVGDINPTHYLKFTDGAGGAFLRVNYNSYYSLRMSFIKSSVRASDKDATDASQRLRNLDFASEIYEASGVLEFNFFKYAVTSHNKFAPFSYIGIAAFHFNPTTTLNGKTYELQPLETEGQSRPYSLITGAIPFGAGFKANIAGKVTLGAEIGYRWCFTDYLDDVSKNYANKAALKNTQGPATDLSDRSGEVNNGVNIGREGSQRGDESRKDLYMFAGITLTYTFVPQKCPTFD